jgi:hypothetical protein
MGSAARVTSAAEGLPRRRFTVAEVEAMVAAGVMEEDERVELIGGELVPMSPKGTQHEVVKAALLRRWYRVAPDDVDLVPETTFRLSDDTYLEPHVVIYPRASGIRGLTSAKRAAGRRDRRLFASLRHRSEGGALRQLRHSRAMGHRRGSADDTRLPRAGRRRLPRRARLRGVR